ncbi:MAG: MBL fold metallo-hydrolase [Actinomycetota bacterium]|nr:MBL fold metallo-hydrolase [Actinomycetota bacterium]
MIVAGFPAGTFGTNCFVIACDPGEPCLIIDPGQDSIDGLMEIISEHRLLPAAVLVTHGHLDHAWSVAPLSHDFGIPTYIHSEDRYRLAELAGSTINANREALLRMTKGALELTEPEDVRLIADDEVLDFAGIQLRVRHAPGHTEGSVVFERAADDEVPSIMFSGDLLFAGSIGRTDLDGGSMELMQQSLQRIVLPADDDMVVLPGHGPQTTIGQERMTNPFLQLGNEYFPARTGL